MNEAAGRLAMLARRAFAAEVLLTPLHPRPSAPTMSRITASTGQLLAVTEDLPQQRAELAEDLKERTMDLDVSKVINRSPAVVFDFVAVHHLQNHPRWDQKMELKQLTDGPVGVGTRFNRRHTRLDVPIEGTMEVVEFEPDRAMGVVIHDNTPNGPLEVHSRMTVEPVGEGSTNLTVHLDIPAMTASMDPSMVQASLDRMKQLIEAET